MSNVKVLFLDIDGVLNTHRAHIAFGSSQWDPVGVAILNRVCKETNTKIVISSVWRGSMSKWMHAHQILDAVGLGSHGICPSHVGITEYDSDSQVHRTPPGHDNPRGRKIQDWIDKYKPANYAIIDDDIDMLSSQSAHFVACDGSEGIGAAEYTRLISILSGDTMRSTDPTQLQLPLDVDEDNYIHNRHMGGVWEATYSFTISDIHADNKEFAGDIAGEEVVRRIMSEYKLSPKLRRLSPEEVEASKIQRTTGDEREAKANA